ncbi:LexA family transcriptional repressor [Paenibacillus larvae subsp. pulvifaciens]|uniref:LexA family transcriptional repressor n=1 Tax=Paenibacillus larvae subsp. pulvifaciens TaxID=1477 RepID=A0A1V0UUR6_9BACL|nr:LexA family transcriptional regulator [Paenibacillus larvae]ARF68917.1 LexA family transcriptional repressor [Paenibacillus larvae subsp. pulvifaciens]
MFGKKLKELRKLEGWTQEEVAKKLGVTKQTYSHYENETRKPSLEMIKELANVYRVNIDDIFSEDGKKEDIIFLPVVGQICCGNGVLAYENIESYESVPREWVKGAEHFFLRAKGDSMNGARIYDNDLILIRKQPTVENGEIAAILVEEEAVLKRVYKNGEQLVLQSENPKYPPIFAPPVEVCIIGKLVMNIVKYD